MKILTLIRDIIEVAWWEAVQSIEGGCRPLTVVRYVWWALDECFITHSHMTPSEQRAYIDEMVSSGAWD